MSLRAWQKLKHPVEHELPKKAGKNHRSQVCYRRKLCIFFFNSFVFFFRLSPVSFFTHISHLVAFGGARICVLEVKADRTDACGSALFRMVPTGHFCDNSFCS